MNIRDGFLSLQQVFGNGPVDPSVQATAKAQAATAAGKEGLPADEARVSSAASLATQAASAPDVRMEKVTPIQQALAAGTYKVSDSAVAGKLIDHMLQR